MSNSGTGKGLATENVAGNINVQCLGDEQPIVDGSGQNAMCGMFDSGSQDSSGQNIYIGMGQIGSGSGNANGEASSSIPKPHVPTAQASKRKQPYASIFRDNRASSDASRAGKKLGIEIWRIKNFNPV